MPRGPHDRDIKDQSKDDHARKRREEFLKKRFPDGEPSSPDDQKRPRKDKPAGTADKSGNQH